MATATGKTQQTVKTTIRNGGQAGFLVYAFNGDGQRVQVPGYTNGYWTREDAERAARQITPEVMDKHFPPAY